METWIQYIFLASRAVILTLALSTSIQAAEATEKEEVETQVWNENSTLAEPEIKRKNVDIADIDALDFEIGVFAGQMNVEDFGTNSLSGISLSYHITEDFFATASFGQTETGLTSFEIISGTLLLTESEREFEYYDLNLGWNILPGEGFIGQSFSFNSSFYLIAGAGITNFAADNRFTVNAGIGYKVIMNDWVAVQFEVRDHMFDIDLLGEDKTTHNVNYNLGISFYF